MLFPFTELPAGCPEPRQFDTDNLCTDCCILSGIAVQGPLVAVKVASRQRPCRHSSHSSLLSADRKASSAFYIVLLALRVKDVVVASLEIFFFESVPLGIIVIQKYTYKFATPDLLSYSASSHAPKSISA